MQKSFFDSESEDIKITTDSTLHITHNGNVVNLGISEIFDYNKYNHFIGVTFSISPTFMNDYLCNFDKLEITVGIQEDRVQQGANLAAKNIASKIIRDLVNESSELYSGLTTDFKKKINNKAVELFVPLAHSIHSKFYLLENDVSKDTRIILGSANLSERAFNSTYNQFENIIIFDNDPLYHVYLAYYLNILRPVTTNYFPKELLLINTKKLRKITKVDITNVDEVIYLSNEELQKIKEKAIEETFTTVSEKITLGIIPADIPEEMRNIQDDRRHEIKKEKEMKKQEEIAYRLTKEAINPRAKEAKIKSRPLLNKVINKEIRVEIIEHEDTLLPKRQLMINRPEERNLSKDITGLFVPSDLDESILNLIGRRANPDEIRKNLEVINDLIKSFEKFTIKYEDSYGARIFEAILYTFTSPFIFEIKRHARSEEERNDIPQFLFLGGIPGSGKSSLLKILARFTNQPNPILYDSIVPQSSRKHSQTMNVLYNWFEETNVAPLLIDEIPNDFFTNPKYGNELIVNISNQSSYNLHPIPTLIGSTNTDGYTLEERANRRSYYLKIDNKFDELKREESTLVYSDVYSKINSTLFYDFVIRFAERLADDSLVWANFGDAGKIDFLYHSREIFKEYYEEVNLPLPIYFPLTRYDDTRETNIEKWKKLFAGSSKSDFHFDENTGNLLFRISSIDENIPMWGKGKPSEIYKNALSSRVVVGSKDGVDIELDTPLFFKWIELDNPFIDFYKNSIRDAYLENPSIFTLDKRKNEVRFDIEDIVGAGQVIKANRYIEYIPDEITIDNSEGRLTLIADEFYNWIGVNYKKSLWERLTN